MSDIDQVMGHRIGRRDRSTLDLELLWLGKEQRCKNGSEPKVSGIR